LVFSYWRTDALPSKEASIQGPDPGPKQGQPSTKCSEQNLNPVVSNLQTITSEAARMTTMAAAQVERADRMFADLSRRAEQVMAAVPTLLGPAGKGLAFLNGIKAALAAIHELRRSSRRGATSPDEEDALFIG